MKQHCRLSAAGLLLAVACGPAPRPADDKALVAADVDSATRAFEQAQRDRDPERIVSFLAPGFYMYSDGVRSGYDSVAAAIRAGFRGIRFNEPGFSNIAVLVQGPDEAISSFAFRDSIITGAGELQRAQGATTLVWKRLNGKWQIVYAHADHHPVTK